MEFTEDGLLPALPEGEYEWLEPDQELMVEDPIRHLIGWVIAVHQANQIVWPADPLGEHPRPPDEHLLDHLTRQEFSGRGDTSMLAEFEARPEAGTVAVMYGPKLPECDMCHREPARYDGPVSDTGDPPWGWMCSSCFAEHSTGRFGLGIGQYLMLPTEIPDHVLAAQETARKFWKGRLRPGE